MARPKGFDCEEALDRTMRTFWCRGYEATSIQDLVEATGLSRSSLYDTFGDKHAVFLAALERYSARMGDAMSQQLEAPDAGIDAIRGVFECALKSAIASETGGCMAVNASAEIATRDPEAARVLAKGLSRNEASFLAALRNAEARGEIRPGTDLRASARFLVNALHGLHITARITQDTDTLRNIVDVTLAAVA